MVTASSPTTARVSSQLDPLGSPREGGSRETDVALDTVRPCGELLRLRLDTGERPRLCPTTHEPELSKR